MYSVFILFFSLAAESVSEAESVAESVSESVSEELAPELPQAPSPAQEPERSVDSANALPLKLLMVGAAAGLVGYWAGNAGGSPPKSVGHEKQETALSESLSTKHYVALVAGGLTALGAIYKHSLPEAQPVAISQSPISLRGAIGITALFATLMIGANAETCRSCGTTFYLPGRFQGHDCPGFHPHRHGFHAWGRQADPISFWRGGENAPRSSPCMCGHGGCHN